MQSPSSDILPDSAIIRTGSDGRLRYSPKQRRNLLEGFDRSGLSAMAFSRQHGVFYQTFIAWLRKRRDSSTDLPSGTPVLADGPRRFLCPKRQAGEEHEGAEPS